MKNFIKEKMKTHKKQQEMKNTIRETNKKAKINRK